MINMFVWVWKTLGRYWWGSVNIEILLKNGDNKNQPVNQTVDLKHSSANIYWSDFREQNEHDCADESDWLC